MIYEDVYQFLMKKSSAKEFDIVLNLINNTDWNSKVDIDVFQLAKRAGTTTRYVKEVFKKFTSLKKGKTILSSVPSSRKQEYKLLLGKSNLFYSKGERYCKKFSFFYTPEFQQLSIYSKRILLEAAMILSNNELTHTYIGVEHFLFKNEVSSGLIPSKKTLLKSLDEINSVFEENIYASLASSVFNRKETIVIQFNPTLLQNTFENQTEKRVLRKSLFECGYHSYLPDEHCIEILKTGKYIFNSFFRFAKEEQRKAGLSIGLIDEILELARFVYQTSIKHLAGNIVPNDFINKDPKELSAYFSSIVFSVASEELVKRNNHKISIENLLTKFSHSLSDKELEPIQDRFIFAELISNALSKWCEDWIASRIQTNNQSTTETDESIVKNNSLKDFINQTFVSIEEKAKEWCSNTTRKDILSYLTRFRESVGHHLDIQIGRLNEQFFIS